MIVNLREVETLGGPRALRAVRTPTVRSGKRAEAYSMGLAQAEELRDAARTISPIASPILHYYALAQASRAVIASSPLGNNEWEPKAGHGLRLIVDGSSGALEDLWVEESGEGLAQKLAKALGCPLLEGRASMAELIAALPGQSLFPAGDDHPPRALQCRLGSKAAEPETGGVLLSLESPSPSLPVSWPDGSDEITALLKLYPTLKAGPQPEKLGIVPDPYGRPSDLELGFGSAVRYVQDVQQVVDIWVSPLTRVFDAVGVSGWVLPGIGGNKAAQHPLLTWLLVLYGLSMLARYHPVIWRGMLDVDRNPRAEPLERLIENESERSMGFAELEIREFMRRNTAP